MLKKSYTGFIVWMFLFIGILFSLSFLPVEDESIMIRSVFVFTSLAIAGMMLLIYFTEQVYWINGVTYEHKANALSLFTDPNGHDSCINVWVDESGTVTEIDWSSYTG